MASFFIDDSDQETMNYLLISLKKDAPEGFVFQQTDPIKLQQTPFAIWADSLEATNTLVKNNPEKLHGLIATPGADFNYSRLDQNLWLLTLPQNMLGHLKSIALGYLEMIDLEKDAAKHKHTEAQLQAILDYSPTLISTKDLEGNITLANKQFEVLAGPAPEAFINKNIYDLFPHHIADALWKNDLAAQNGPIRTEEVVEHKDGTLHTYLTTKFPITDSRDELLGTCAISTDITDRIEADQLLQKNSRILTEAQHIAQIGSWELDLTNNNLIWSDEIYRIFEIDPEKFGASYEAFIETVHPDDREIVNNAYSDSLVSKHPYSIEHRLLLPDGRIKHVLESCETRYDASGQPLISIGTVQDITERKLTERSLEESEARFRSLFHSSVVGMVVAVGCESTIQEWNSGAEQIFGYTAVEAINQPLTILIPERFQKAHSEGFKKAITKGELRHKGLTHELTGLRKNGEEFPLQLTLGCWKREEDIFFSAIILDISDRKQAEEELKAHKQNLEGIVEARTAELTKSLQELTIAQTKLIKAEKQATSASLAKSEFLAHMSHEIRTPMNGIIAMSDLLLTMEEDDEKSDYLRIIKHSGAALLSILNDILDISKIEAGKMMLEKQRFKLKDILNDVSALFKKDMESKNISFHCMINVDVPDIIISDSTRLRQILANLLGNAVKFTETNGAISLHISVSNKFLSIEKDTLYLEFRIEDNGIGIPESRQKNIFDAFIQADSSITRKYGGTGLGLQICKQLCQLMDGDIELVSSEGVGTTITFRIGVKPGSETSKKKENISSESKSDPSKISILLVEDNPINQRVASAILKKLGYNISCVENGQKAIESAENHHYDIVLMDCQMPVMDGYEATRRLRNDQRFSQLPIIAMTASATMEEQKKCKQVGMNDFIAKPIDISSVRNTLTKWH